PHHHDAAFRPAFLVDRRRPHERFYAAEWLEIAGEVRHDLFLRMKRYTVAKRERTPRAGLHRFRFHAVREHGAFRMEYLRLPPQLEMGRREPPVAVVKVRQVDHVLDAELGSLVGLHLLAFHLLEEADIRAVGVIEKLEEGEDGSIRKNILEKETVAPTQVPA